MNKKHKKTLNNILERPERSDIPWSNIESLFVALGAEISEGKGSRVRVALAGVRAVFHSLHPQRVTKKPMVSAVRKFLEEAEVIK